MTRLELPFPPSTNNTYANVNGRRVKTKKAREYTTTIMWHCAQTNTDMSSALRSQGDAPRLAVTIDVHPPDKRRRDLANLEKLAIDAIFKYIGLDDSLIDDLHLVRREVDRPNGKLIITITNIEEES